MCEKIKINLISLFYNFIE